jgi:hypothetical protein
MTGRHGKRSATISALDFVASGGGGVDVCVARSSPTYEEEMTTTTTGSCLCGAVRYAIVGELGLAEYCHCSMCRKAHGAAFSCNAEVRSSEFRWVSGTDAVTTFASSADRRKCFCRHCGSQLAVLRLDVPETMAITMGTLDSDPGTVPSRHVFIDSRATWFSPSDHLPRFRVYPGFEPEE